MIATVYPFYVGGGMRSLRALSCNIYHYYYLLLLLSWLLLLSLLLLPSYLLIILIAVLIITVIVTSIIIIYHYYIIFISYYHFCYHYYWYQCYFISFIKWDERGKAELQDAWFLSFFLSFLRLLSDWWGAKVLVKCEVSFLCRMRT